MFNDCKYIISTTKRSQGPNYLTNLPEFVFLGRSNVGKSSFINALTNRKSLAKTSSKPGKTKTMNYFFIDESFYLVDAPGYGYASRSYGSRLDFGDYIEDYLNNNQNEIKPDLKTISSAGESVDISTLETTHLLNSLNKKQREIFSKDT